MKGNYNQSPREKALMFSVKSLHLAANLAPALR